MPEYLSPGVYIEEIDIGPKPIEGVSTGTAGFLGPTERGPIDPSLITSFEEFQRKFGSFINESYMAYAIDGFFRNGGKRCYISRIYSRDNAKFGEHKLAADRVKSQSRLPVLESGEIEYIIKQRMPIFIENPMILKD